MLQIVIAPLLLAAGLYFTIGLGFFRPSKQIRLVLNAFVGNKSKDKSKISAWSGLFTALAGTVGTGNIVGVASAIMLGGAGAIFWMWICAFVSLATKYTEVFLAVKYKKNGSVCGPMMYIEHGLGKRYRPLAILYCILCICASMGVGNAIQSNAISESFLVLIKTKYYINFNGDIVIRLIVGAVFAAITYYALCGGAKRITKFTSIVVPFMGLLYVSVCMIMVIKSEVSIGSMFGKIFIGAFNPRAVMGGALGVTLAKTMSIGVSRGVFSHEAGMGSGAIAHATATETTPKRQAALGIVEVVADTFIICSMTAFMLLSSSIVITPGAGVMETVRAGFATLLGDKWAGIFLFINIALFAYSSIICWAYYGSVCVKYLFNNNFTQELFKLCFCLFTVFGACVALESVWEIASILNMLMALPNLYALIKLFPVVREQTKN